MVKVVGYDLVDSFTSNKPYIDKSRNKLYLIGVYNYKYFIWLKRFNKDIDRYDYFILLTNTYSDDTRIRKCNYNNNHELRTSVPDVVIKELDDTKVSCFNVNLILDDEKEDYVVYKVEV